MVWVHLSKQSNSHLKRGIDDAHGALFAFQLQAEILTLSHRDDISVTSSSIYFRQYSCLVYPFHQNSTISDMTIVSYFQQHQRRIPAYCSYMFTELMKVTLMCAQEVAYFLDIWSDLNYVQRWHIFHGNLLACHQRSISLHRNFSGGVLHE